MLDHLLGDINVGDHPVAQRANGLDAVRGLAHHHLCVIADGLDLLYAIDGFDRHNRRLVEHDALTAQIDDGICRAEIDRQILRTELEQILKHNFVRNF